MCGLEGKTKNNPFFNNEQRCHNKNTGSNLRMPRKGSENKMYVFPPIDGISIKICKCKTNFHSWIYSLCLYVSDYICILYNYTWIVNCQIVSYYVLKL